MTQTRISPRTGDSLRELAALLGMPIQHVVDAAVEAYRRNLLLDRTNDAYRALRADPAAWAHEVAERRAWDSTLEDGQD